MISSTAGEPETVKELVNRTCGSGEALTYAMIHGIISQWWSTQCGYDLEFS